MCEDCTLEHIPAAFQRAFDKKDEDDYPPRWGKIELQVEDFRDVLDPDFVSRYKVILRDYETFGKKVYCRHQLNETTAPARGCLAPVDQVLALDEATITALSDGTSTVICKAFVGPKSKPSGSVGNVHTCYRCNGKVCLSCELSLDQVEHDCQPVESKSVEYIMRGQKRGKDYQTCPKCNHVLMLRDGCNSMKCDQCRTDFCFLCGKKCYHDSDHWKLGNPCAKWGQLNREDDHNAVPPSDTAIIDWIVVNGVRRIREGGQIDRTFMDAAFSAVRRFNTFLVVLYTSEEVDAGAQPEDFWAAIRRMHQKMMNNDEMTLIAYQIGSYAMLRGATPEDQNLADELSRFAQAMLDCLPLHASLAALDAVPPKEEQKMFIDAHVAAAYWLHKDSIAREFEEGDVPLLDDLMARFQHGAPEWLKAAANEVLEAAERTSTG